MGSQVSIAGVGGRLSRTSSLDVSASRLRYVSGARKDALAHLGLHTIHDVLLHVPHKYLDFTSVHDIAHTDVGTTATVVGTIDRVKLKRPRPRLSLVEIFILDDTSVMQASFFGQPWLAQELKVGDRVALSGDVSFAYGFKQMRSPFIDKLSTGDATEASATTEVSAATEARNDKFFARILPVHRLSDGISASWMRRIVSTALADYGDICDFMPAKLVEKRGLMSEARALRTIHFPVSFAQKEAARRRLAYDELLCLQLALKARQQLSLSGRSAHQHRIDGKHVTALLENLPFRLTEEQQQAADEILAGMQANQVMNRLLLGDVGTGKTAVAAVALAAVADSSTQAAMMAPTSVLAQQYARKLGPLLEKAGISWALITGATKPQERAQLTKGLATGAISVAFGTTALLSEDVDFHDLSLIVIDEQHRFGVGQRAALRNKGNAADLLAMTATPIPRSLALTIYGDLSFSRIAHRPQAGAGVSTRSIAPENLDLAYGAIQEAVAAGHQAYVICPLVDLQDDGSKLDDVPEDQRSHATHVHAAQQVMTELSQGALKGLRLGLLTGKMTPTEKDEVMAQFVAAKIDVLVATTVVEVGVDVPNATAMLVYDADRFGLATLHQLRGRVGRGSVAGEVFLCCAAKKGSPARKRLEALEKSTDGFKLAELDLKLRHEGEVLGYRQSGGVSLKICDLAVDGDLVEAAHKDARLLYDSDPQLTGATTRLLAYEVRRRFGGYFDEVIRV